jgi:superfamily I DNA/RNA helicase
LGWSWANTSRLRKPNGDVWPDLPARGSGMLPWSTAHGFKGLQAPAVAVVIGPPPRGLSQEDSGVELWDRNLPGEARRVLYVAASRAERLAILVVQDNQYEAVLRCLDRDGVSYVLA